MITYEPSFIFHGLELALGAGEESGPREGDEVAEREEHGEAGGAAGHQSWGIEIGGEGGYR